MRRVVVAGVALLAACASSAPPDDDTTSLVPPAQVAQQDNARLGEIQTQMTELLERLDVLNDRIAKLENESSSRGGLQPPEPSSSHPVVAPTPPPTEVRAAAGRPYQTNPTLAGAQLADDYRSAVLLYGRGRVADARRAFQAVYDAAPTGELADNALFWIGETYFAAGDYGTAMRFYRRVTEEFAEQNKAPDALFKTGVALAKTGDLVLARKTFEDVVAKYPYSTSAASAKQELKRIKY